jgi:hypothetical protein
MIWVFLILQLLSDIVHDLIPPLMDPAKCEAPAAALKRNAAMGSRIIKSMIGVDDDHGHTSQAKQSPVELSDSDPMTKQLGKEFWELQVANQLAFTRNSEELLEGE